jgi:hypothetical protein
MRCCLTLFVLVLFASTASLAMEGSVTGAKDLFYDPVQGSTLGVQVPVPPKPAPPSSGRGAPAGKSTPPPAVKPVARRAVTVPAEATKAVTNKNRGLHYWIELEEPGGEGYYVSDQYVFRSGQRIRLHFVSNTGGQILLVQMGASGTSSLLFPNPSKGVTDNRLKPGEDRVLPGESYWFRFDSNPGTERLVALFASDAELERFPVKSEMGPADTKALLQTVSHVRGSKDLVIETETQTASEIGTYGVNLKGEPVILEIVLQHR